MLVVPTVPRVPTIAEVSPEPIAVNTMLGTYTNFVNLLDLCALTVPVGDADDGHPPPSVTLIAPGVVRRRARVGARRCCRPRGER